MYVSSIIEYNAHMVAATFSSRLVTILRQGCLLSHCFIVAAMLTIPAMASSSLMNRSRYRLPDSSASVSSIQDVLSVWWKTVGVRDASKLLRPIVTVWPSRGIPLPSDLVADNVFSLVIEMARADTRGLYVPSLQNTVLREVLAWAHRGSQSSKPWSCRGRC